MRVLVTGAAGQVGADVARALEGRAEVVALDRAALDLARPDAIVRCVREAKPRLIVNAAAYTAVDRAESEAQLARAVNARAPAILAEEAERSGALLVHYSTDYVFDGTKAGPYVESDPTAPLNVYGETKLEGERAVAASGCAHVIVRTSWVYAPRGRNFLLTMLRLAETRDELRVVDDQRGAPTASAELARATLALFVPPADATPLGEADLQRVGASSGLYHASAAGETTWCGFARAIFEQWSARAGGGFRMPRVVPIRTSEYPTPARRPANSVLSSELLARTFGVRLAHWQDGLARVLSALGRRDG
ncbi:MAG TPA: dTDP-4-dehydrorhamnose reductase [Usitatibacter sp.]|nr:dTDP-4-dehydrorhamnose reductase [Usitatibacter sp.]